jgi:ATP-binding cassette, subfamily D (ALD), peroxisomal long-chain fatty acid import protein
MTVLSTLRQRSQPTLSSFVKTYAAHRPLIQRILTAGFIVHVLSSTFYSLSIRPSPLPTSKGKAGEQSVSVEAGKPPRVAVRLCLMD